MKQVNLLATIIFVFCVSCSFNTQDKRGSDKYKFDKNGISREVLENYLEKSITMVYFLSPNHSTSEPMRTFPYSDDDIRMIKNIGAKFLGRTFYRWGMESRLNEADYFNTAAKRVKQMHEYDPDIVFQACLFEIVTTEVNEVAIPEWVFRNLGLPMEKRNFSYEAMLADNGKFVNHWREGSSVPDISKLETKLWFYFLAGSFINVGCEAFHIGQVELIGMNDPDRNHWADIIAKIRNYASKHARRNWVIIDAHTPYGGFIKDGVSLLDFNSFPMRIKDIPEQPYHGELEVNYLDGLYLKSKGCITPSGWECDNLPYLVEFDNFGIRNVTNVPTVNSIHVWGWDEISWFALQPEEYRNEFIKYAYQWLKDTDPNGHLQMVGCRSIKFNNETSDSYRANTRSETCPIGYSQEETIKELWNK